MVSTVLFTNVTLSFQGRWVMSAGCHWDFLEKWKFLVLKVGQRERCARLGTFDEAATPSMNYLTFNEFWPWKHKFVFANYLKGWANIYAGICDGCTCLDTRWMESKDINFRFLIVVCSWKYRKRSFAFKLYAYLLHFTRYKHLKPAHLTEKFFPLTFSTSQTHSCKFVFEQTLDR